MSKEVVNYNRFVFLSYSAISVATAHGQRSCLHQLLSHPLNFSAKRGEKEVLSLEEILAEGSAGTSPQQQTVDGRGNRREGKEPVFNKVQTKALQEAMYHSAESNHLGKTNLEEIILKSILIYFLYKHEFFHRYHDGTSWIKSGLDVTLLDA